MNSYSFGAHHEKYFDVLCPQFCLWTRLGRAHGTALLQKKRILHTAWLRGQNVQKWGAGNRVAAEKRSWADMQVFVGFVVPEVKYWDCVLKDSSQNALTLIWQKWPVRKNVFRKEAVVLQGVSLPWECCSTTNAPPASENLWNTLSLYSRARYTAITASKLFKGRRNPNITCGNCVKLNPVHKDQCTLSEAQPEKSFSFLSPVSVL